MPPAIRNVAPRLRIVNWLFLVTISPAIPARLRISEVVETMRGLVIVLLAAVTAFAADDPWTKVRDLKSGTELRIFKKGGLHPIQAKMEEANPDSLIIVL